MQQPNDTGGLLDDSHMASSDDADGEHVDQVVRPRPHVDEQTTSVSTASVQQNAHSPMLLSRPSPPNVNRAGSKVIIIVVCLVACYCLWVNIVCLGVMIILEFYFCFSSRVPTDMRRLVMRKS